MCPYTTCGRMLTDMSQSESGCTFSPLKTEKPLLPPFTNIRIYTVNNVLLFSFWTKRTPMHNYMDWCCHTQMHRGNSLCLECWSLKCHRIWSAMVCCWILAHSQWRWSCSYSAGADKYSLCWRTNAFHSDSRNLMSAGVSILFVHCKTGSKWIPSFSISSTGLTPLS